MSDCKLLSNINIHNSWTKFLSNNRCNQLKKIEKEINNGDEYTPDTSLILRFLEMDLSKVPVLILGQDPYPQKGVATGRAFEVGGLNSWTQKFRNVSLKNIIRAIYKAQRKEEKKYSEILSEINEGTRLNLSDDFNILSPNKLFEYWWDKENILLLNTAFTCEIGKPNSHTKIWSDFTHEILEFIATENPKIIWFLWGRNAEAVVSGIEIKNKSISSHPMMCTKKDNDFLFGKINHFANKNMKINWTGFISKKL